jgi:hypothetical protein
VYGANTGGSPDKCVRVSSNTLYYLGAKFRAADPFSHCDVSFYSGTNCTTEIVVTHPMIALPSGGQNWTAVSTSFTTPANTQSAFVSCFLYQASMDQIYLNPNVNAF